MAFFYVNVFIGAFQELVFTPTQNTRTADGVIPYPNLLHTGIWGVMFVSLEIVLKCCNFDYIGTAVSLSIYIDNCCRGLIAGRGRSIHGAGQ